MLGTCNGCIYSTVDVSIKDIPNNGNLSNEDTVRSPNHIQ